MRIGRILDAVLAALPPQALPCFACGAPPRKGNVLVVIVSETAIEPARCQSCGYSVDSNGRTLIGRPLVIQPAA